MTFVQSESTAARRRVPVYLVDATDGITAETGETGGQPQISKNGGSWTNTTNTLVAVGNGAYYVELTAAELNTLGRIQIRYKSSNTAEFSVGHDVIAANVHDATALGLSRLNADNARLVGTTVANPTPVAYNLKLASGHGALVEVGDRLRLNGKWRRITAKATDEVTLDDEAGLSPTDTTYAYTIPWESGRLSDEGLIEAETSVGAALSGYGVSTVTTAQVNSEVDTALADAGVTSTRMGYIDGLNVASLATRLGTLPTSGTVATLTAADVWAVGTRTITGGTITTVSDKTGYSLAVAPPTASAIASQVRTELTTELARIDVATSTRLSSASYTAPDNAAIANIETTVTNNLDATISSRLASASYTAPDNAGISTLLTRVPAVIDVSDLNTFADRYLTMIELDGSVYRFTVNALEQGPAGGGGGSADEEAIANAVVAALAGQSVTVTPSVDEERGELTIVEGEEKTFTFSITGWTGTNQDNQTVTLRIVDRLTYDTEGSTASADVTATGTASQTGQTVSVSITVTDTQSATLTPTNPPVSGFTHVAQLWGAGPGVIRTYNVTVRRGVQTGS